MRAASVVIAVAVATAGQSSPIRQVDHVMFTGGPELSGLVFLLRDKFQLPVVFDGPSQTPPTPGTCLSFGNVCLEVVPLASGPGEEPRKPAVGSVFLEASDFPKTAAALNARRIDHFPPAQQPRWTTIGLRGLGGGIFFIEYREDMASRRAAMRRELEKRGGGALGIVRALEIARASDYADEVRPAWVRLFGEPSAADPNLFVAGDGPAIRLMTDIDPRANRVVAEVRSLDQAGAALTRLKIPFSSGNGDIVIDPQALQGLSLVLR